MPGQGTIVATGAIGYPPGLTAVDPERAARARRAEGHDDDQHLRPPRDPGRGVGLVPAPRSTSCSRARTASTTRCSRRSALDRARGGRPQPAARRHRRTSRCRPPPRPPPAPCRTRRCSRPCRPPPRWSRPTACTATWPPRLDPLGSEPVGDPALDPRERGPHARADAAHPGLGAARGGAGRDLRRRAAPPARDLRRHDRLRDRAHLRPRAARLAAPGDRVGHLPPAARARGEAAAARAAVQRRGARELPAQGLPRQEAVLDRGPRRARADARRGDRAGLRRGRARGGAGHGPPRPPERARAHGRPPLRVDPGRVRGRADAGRGDRGARGRHRRREVPLRRLGHLQDARRQGRDRHALAQPEPPRVREPGDRGPRARRPDLAQGARADARPQRRCCRC